MDSLPTPSETPGPDLPVDSSTQATEEVPSSAQSPQEEVQEGPDEEQEQEPEQPVSPDTASDTQSATGPDATTVSSPAQPLNEELSSRLEDIITSPHGNTHIVERSPGGRYVQLSEKLGSGASKEVYRAYDTQEGIEVAWNVVHLAGVPKNERNRIVNEVRLLERLHHHNIISFHGSWVNREKQQVNFVTEILSSGTLKSFVNKVQVIRWKIAKRWATQILSGLQYLHSQDPPVIHRDLKCENIFINGTSGDLRIGDLGLSTVHRNGKALSVLGTPEFMAPDMYEEDAYDEKVDIYAFGMCLLEIFTKEIPYRECSNPAQIYRKVSRGDPPDSLRRLKSRHAREFIELCLGTKGEDGKYIRPSATELLEHPFLQQRPADDDEVEVDPPMQDMTIRETYEPSSSTSYPAATSRTRSLKQEVAVPAATSTTTPQTTVSEVHEPSVTEDESDRFDEMPDSETAIREPKVLIGRGQELQREIMSAPLPTDRQTSTASDGDAPLQRALDQPPAVVGIPTQSVVSEPIQPTASLPAANNSPHYLVAAAVIQSENQNTQPYEDDILKLVVTLPVDGQTQNVQFDFHLVQDDPVQVAKEMVAELGIPPAAVLEISETISGLARVARVNQDQFRARSTQQGHQAVQGVGQQQQQQQQPQQPQQPQQNVGHVPQVPAPGMMPPQGHQTLAQQPVAAGQSHQSMPEYVSASQPLHSQSHQSMTDFVAAQQQQQQQQQPIHAQSHQSMTDFSQVQQQQQQPQQQQHMQGQPVPQMQASPHMQQHSREPAPAQQQAQHMTSQPDPNISMSPAQTHAQMWSQQQPVVQNGQQHTMQGHTGAMGGVSQHAPMPAPPPQSNDMQGQNLGMYQNQTPVPAPPPLSSDMQGQNHAMYQNQNYQAPAPGMNATQGVSQGQPGMGYANAQGVAQMQGTHLMQNPGAQAAPGNYGMGQQESMQQSTYQHGTSQGQSGGMQVPTTGMSTAQSVVSAPNMSQVPNQTYGGPGGQQVQQQHQVVVPPQDHTQGHPQVPMHSQSMGQQGRSVSTESASTQPQHLVHAASAGALPSDTNTIMSAPTRVGAEDNSLGDSSNTQQPSAGFAVPASTDMHMNGVHGVPSIEDSEGDPENELLQSELRKLDEDYQKNMMRAMRVFDTRMDTLQRTLVQREEQHQKTLERHQKEVADFEKRRQQEEIEQNRRIEQLKKEWAEQREAARLKLLAESQAAEIRSLSSSPPEESILDPRNYGHSVSER